MCCWIVESGGCDAEGGVRVDAWWRAGPAAAGDDGEGDLGAVALSPHEGADDDLLSHVYCSLGRRIVRLVWRRGRLEADGDWAPEASASDEIADVRLSPGGEYLCAADDAGDVHVLRLAGAQRLRRLTGAHTSLLSAACFVPRLANALVSGGLDSSVVWWDYAKGRRTGVWRATAASSGGGMLFNPPYVHALVAEYPFVAAALGDGRIAVFDVDGRDEPACVLVGHEARVSCLTAATSRLDAELLRQYAAARKKGRARASAAAVCLVSGSDDGTLRVWRVRVDDAEWRACGCLAHGAKLNWLSASASAAAEQEVIVLVGDVLDSLTCFKLRTDA